MHTICQLISYTKPVWYQFLTSILYCNQLGLDMIRYADWIISWCHLLHGPLTRYVKLRLRMRRECRERFPRHRWLSDLGIHHGTCVTHVLWCMPGSLTSSFLWSRRRGKRSRHSRHMRNPQIYVSGKRPIDVVVPAVCSHHRTCQKGPQSYLAASASQSS